MFHFQQVEFIIIEIVGTNIWRPYALRLSYTEKSSKKKMEMFVVLEPLLMMAF